jgi:hypothetical protein
VHFPVLDPNLVLWFNLASDVGSIVVSSISLFYVLKVHGLLKIKL